MASMIKKNGIKVLIIGAGRMGIRHAQGAIQIDALGEVCLVDIADAALENARSQLSSYAGYWKVKTASPGEAKGIYDFVIIASTASGRIATCLQALAFSPAYVLIEKPLGQSYNEVEELVNLFEKEKAVVSVNLNTRLYDFVQQLKKDLHSLPQFSGAKKINYNGGALGIGANGIHYLDLLFFLLEANSARLTAAEIEPELIPSGRGPGFADFGGWACISFYNAQEEYLGRSLMALSATSTVFGGWDIIGSHGRIRINELENQRVDILRKPDSQLPVNRYAADYLPPVIHSIESPLLGELTRKWMESLIYENINLLPAIRESLKVHKLLFDWLSYSSNYKEKFPIT
jgi:predicted dehydrogenase